MRAPCRAGGILWRTLILFHILGQAEWERAKAARRYAPASLEHEGFVHLSTAEQLVRTAARFFAGRTDLVLLAIDPEKTGAPLRFEQADGDAFPHLYGAVPLDAVTEATAFSGSPPGGRSDR